MCSFGSKCIRLNFGPTSYDDDPSKSIIIISPGQKINWNVSVFLRRTKTDKFDSKSHLFVFRSFQLVLALAIALAGVNGAHLSGDGALVQGRPTRQNPNVARDVPDQPIGIVQGL